MLLTFVYSKSLTQIPTPNRSNPSKVNRSKFDKYKVASRLLAHYCQGSEQLIIQSLIANSIEESILTYSYDGLTIEVRKDSVSTVKSRLDSWMEDNYIDYLLESTEYS